MMTISNDRKPRFQIIEADPIEGSALELQHSIAEVTELAGRVNGSDDEAALIRSALFSELERKRRALAKLRDGARDSRRLN